MSQYERDVPDAAGEDISDSFGWRAAHTHAMDLSVVYTPRTEDDGWPVPFGKGRFSGEHEGAPNCAL